MLGECCSAYIACIVQIDTVVQRSEVKQCERIVDKGAEVDVGVLLG